ncbi:hypothetical protein KC363_g5220 [Hortaea werneckii]|uniref:RRM domain-containing protein n=1 Tax=Hortaea werneckii TaxID=91943 RepID=A0A3M7FGD8_HORWE|nr:hypothetical protein KC363_g5220 [Hortaea werneckii]KAI7513048.1 hypothetical protein KC347_g1929 [Hortaea werneckii]RMY87968.1 hypothetical protein D0861_05098 [Hortaea werneckii]
MSASTSVYGTRSYPSAMYTRTTNGPSAVSPPDGKYRTESHMYGSSLPSDRYVGERYRQTPTLPSSTSDPLTLNGNARTKPAIVIRRLPRSISADALGSMLIFAGDLLDTQLVRSPYSEDSEYATAIAYFDSQAGALEAQQKLHGKPNTTKETSMIVEVVSSSMMGGPLDRRNTIDGGSSRTQTSSSSSGGSVGGPPGRSRFGSSFQSTEKISPPLPTATTSGEFPMPETSAHFQNLFSPQSPLANGLHDRHRVSGKSIINDDMADDETGDLLKDPVAYAKNGQHPAARRATQPQIPVSRFGSLSLSTADANGLTSPTGAGMNSPRGASTMQSPTSAISPTNMNGMGQKRAYSSSYPRPQYPPVNPADQNPPCNTLYVGNLPIDTSEDELKAIFSKQRGYKRLCFRTKQNGPMCFVEFEDVSFATKALNDLYGYPLHNSIKGGIRLSFSKNPLGVRSNQMSGSNGVMNPQAMAPGYSGPAVSGAGNAAYSSVSGPPPGLAMPPGLSNGHTYRSPPPSTSAGLDGMFTNPFHQPPPSSSPEFSNQLNHHHHHNQPHHHQFHHQPRAAATAVSGGVPAPLGSGTFGKDSRPIPHQQSAGAYTNYMLGR